MSNLCTRFIYSVSKSAEGFTDSSVMGLNFSFIYFFMINVANVCTWSPVILLKVAPQTDQVESPWCVMFSSFPFVVFWNPPFPCLNLRLLSSDVFQDRSFFFCKWQFQCLQNDRVEIKIVDNDDVLCRSWKKKKKKKEQCRLWWWKSKCSPEEA